MSSTTTQNFSLRTSTNVKTVHLVGSWDGYKNQLPLSKDGSKAGAWKGAFRFQTSTLVPGKRYWYYYMMDGYHVSHDPAKPATKEPTTGRQLNILDVPKSGASAAAAAPKRPTVEIPTGRGLSPSRIAHPKPSKPYASRGIREADYNASPVDDLASHLEQASLYGSGSGYSASPPSSVGSSVSSRSSGPGSPASLSSLSDSSSGSSCRCNRYGITRSGARVLIDCKGQRCGYSDDSSSGCSSGDSDSESEIDSSSEDESEDDRRRAPAPRRSAAPSKSAVKPKIVEARPKASAGKTVSRRR